MEANHVVSIIVAIVLSPLYSVPVYGGPADAPQAVAKPLVESVGSVSILTKSGWLLDVQPDGSGRLQFGSGPLDFALFEAGRIDFKGLFGLLPQQESVADSKDSVPVAILQKSGSMSVSRALSKQAAEALFVRAADKAKPYAAKQFDQLRKSHPFLTP